MTDPAGMDISFQTYEDPIEPRDIEPTARGQDDGAPVEELILERLPTDALIARIFMAAVKGS